MAFMQWFSISFAITLFFHYTDTPFFSSPPPSHFINEVMNYAGEMPALEQWNDL